MTASRSSPEPRWDQIRTDVLSNGYAVIPDLCSPEQCDALASMWGREALFRKHVVMKRHAFGDGEYGYFADPLPEAIAALRKDLYAQSQPAANTMMERLKSETRYPTTLEAFRAQCHKAGQTKPTPLLLRYEAGGYNRLHSDLYGDTAFPIQATILLSRPGIDFQGGRFMLVKNSPRLQARGEVIELERGDAVLFPTSVLPVVGARGWRRAQMRHGVSTIRSGVRLAAGIIFHDAA
jgi:hypothetical protein